MVKRIISEKSERIIFVLLWFCFIFLTHFSKAASQPQQFTQAGFNQELRKACLKNDDQQVISLIQAKRFFVKPFINDLIRECISKELNGNITESGQAKAIAEKVASTFEKIYGEKSLTFAVNYLTDWTTDQKVKKLQADSIYAIGTKFRLGNEYDKAIEQLQRALDLYKEINDERGEAEVLGGLGAIYYNFDYQKCLSYYQQALIKREKVDDKQLIGNTLNSFGSVNYQLLNDYPKALEWYDKAEAIRTEIGDLPNLKTTLGYKVSSFKAYGEQLNDAGKYPEALVQCEKAISINSGLNDRKTDGEIISLIGYVYSNLGDYKTAVQRLDEALKIMREINDSIGIAGVYNNYGIVLQHAGRIEKGLEYYNNSLNIYEKYSDLSGSLPVLSNLGTLFFDLKDYVKAEDYQTKTLQINRELNDEASEVNSLLNLANTQIYLGKLNESMLNYNKAYAIAKSPSKPEIIWKVYAGMAENFERRGDYQKAVELNDSSLIVLEGIRDSLGGEDFKSFYLAKERYIFEDIINLLRDLHMKYPDKGYDIQAFQYAERCKSRTLLDLLTESSSGIRIPEPVSLRTFQETCPDKNAVILEYMVGDSSSCLWVITKSEHQIFRMPESKRLKEQIEIIRFAMLDPTQEVSEFFAQTGYSLYEELIKPAEKYLSKMSRLVIIPDGILNYLPFEVLLTDNKKNTNNPSYSGMPFLINRYPISYGQSASVLKRLLSNSDVPGKIKPGDKKLVAFGDPVYENPNSALTENGNNYSRLEYSGQEILKIASFFKKDNSEIYLRENANEESIKRTGNLKKFNYLHFATHGFIDEDKPDLSSLVLTKSIGSSEDGFLQSNEIFKLNLNADLVVLSACQTGLGKMVRGEGIIGLTRAFMYAGTPSVLVSLWSVSDLSTATLMEEFYKNLIKYKLSKTDALRKAQLTLMNDEKFAHPFYWAPFVIFGDWR